MAKNAAAVVAKWKQNAGAAQGSYTDGIQGTDIDVMGRAAAAGAAAVRNYSDAWSSGRVQAAIAASGGTANWKAMALKKASNYGTGIAAGEDKMARAMGKLLPAIDGIVGGLPQRVPGNVQANLQRVAGVALALHARKGEFKG